MVAIRVKNYQAVKEASIIVKGLTILKGKSNGGKSSFQKAVMAASNNRFRSKVVRNGEPYAEIKFKYDDDDRMLTVVRNAAGNSPIMRLGNKTKGYETFDKLNREVPDVIRDFHKHGVIQVQNEKYNLNFTSQFEPPLLMRFTTKRVIEILSHSKALEDAKKVQKKLNDSNLQLKGEFKSVDTILSETKNKLHQLSTQMNTLFSNIDLVKDKFDEYKTLQYMKERSEKLYTLFVKMESYTSCIDNLTNILSKIEQIENLQYDKICKLENRVKVFRKLSTRIHKLSDIESLIYEMKDTSKYDKLEKQVKCLMSYNRRIKQLSEIQDVFTSVSNTKDTINRYDELVSVLNSYKVVKDKINEINNKLETAACPYCGISLLEHGNDKH